MCVCWALKMHLTVWGLKTESASSASPAPGGSCTSQSSNFTGANWLFTLSLADWSRSGDLTIEPLPLCRGMATRQGRQSLG